MQTTFDTQLVKTALNLKVKYMYKCISKLANDKLRS